MARSDFQTALQNTSEVNITVTGRVSGRPLSYPVWFALEDDKLYLLPARGSKTEWYKNVSKTPAIQLAARGRKISANATRLTDSAQVNNIIDKFRGRYGAGQVNSLYTGFDVAVEVPLD
jgi:deazaflavin-dependent oxidoreductase (nitroreductase family)